MMLRSKSSDWISNNKLTHVKMNCKDEMRWNKWYFEKNKWNEWILNGMNNKWINGILTKYMIKTLL